MLAYQVPQVDFQDADLPDVVAELDRHADLFSQGRCHICLLPAPEGAIPGSISYSAIYAPLEELLRVIAYRSRMQVVYSNGTVALASCDWLSSERTITLEGVCRDKVSGVALKDAVLTTDFSDEERENAPNVVHPLRPDAVGVYRILLDVPALTLIVHDGATEHRVDNMGVSTIEVLALVSGYVPERFHVNVKPDRSVYRLDILLAPGRLAPRQGTSAGHQPHTMADDQ